MMDNTGINFMCSGSQMWAERANLVIEVLNLGFKIKVCTCIVFYRKCYKTGTAMDSFLSFMPI